AKAVRWLLDGLGVRPQRQPADFESQIALYRSLLADRKVLIVLDNARDCEHVRPLLPGAPGCLVVVTSRSELTGLATTEGSRPLVLSWLTPADARELLARRLGADRLEREAGAAADLVNLCVGLPLALSVVAAQAATRPWLTLASRASELRSRDRLDALGTG